MKKISLFAAIFLAGCHVGPKYREPELDMPKRFVHKEPNKEEQLPKKWWTQFDDAQLTALIEEGCSANFSVRESLQRLLQVRALYGKESAELFPQVDLNGELGRERVSQALFESQFLGPATQNFYKLGFDATWELDFFGYVRKGMEAAHADMAAARESFRDVYISMTSEIAHTYFDLKGYALRLALIERRLEVVEERSMLYRARYAAGLIDEYPLKEAQSEVAALKKAQPELNFKFQQALYRLGILVGKRPDEMLCFLKEPEQLPSSLPALPDVLPSTLLTRRPDIRMAERELAAVTARVGEATAELFPRFSLTGFYRYNSKNSGDFLSAQSRAWRIAPNIHWPLLSFGRIRANITAKKHEMQQALIAYEHKVYTALEDVETALVRHSANKERLEHTEARYRDRKAQLALLEARRDAGYSDSFDYLQELDRLLQEEEALIEQKVHLFTSLFSLYKALGGDWECSITQ